MPATPASSGAAGGKELPYARGQAARFFANADRGRLCVSRCAACGSVFLPRVLCPSCGAAEPAEHELSGRGHVYSFSVSHRAGQPGFEAEVPYVVAVVELEEGVRLMTNLPGADPRSVAIGMPVRLTFEERRGHRIPQFELVS